MSRFTARAHELFAAVKSGNPIPRLVDRSVDAKSLWPANLGMESDKAARILRSFFCDGFVVPYRTLAVCQQDIVRKCYGLAVFHLLRDGLSSVANGSGILISRTQNGTWSDASAILIDNNASLPPGIDVLDVVLVINTKGGMEALLDPVVSLRKSLTVAPGPVNQHQLPITVPANTSAWSYAKSKGEHIELDLGDLVIRDNAAEDERHYGRANVSRREVLTGQAITPSSKSDYLSRTLNAFEQHSNCLSGLPEPGNCPGDRRVKKPRGGT